jgi:alpha-tubulin suppressor-like RCC1 family protein
LECWSDVPSEPSRRLRFPSQVREVALGLKHGCALLEEGSVWCWGANRFGQLGSGAGVRAASTPQRVRGMSFSRITAGDYHTCGVTSGHRVACWGANQLVNLERTPEPGGVVCGIVSSELETRVSWRPSVLPGLTAVVDVASTPASTCALHDRGQSVSCWGLTFISAEASPAAVSCTLHPTRLVVPAR